MLKQNLRHKPFPFTEEQIRAKAYKLWQQRGAASSAEDNWNDAIRLLQRDQSIKQLFKPIQQIWWRTGLELPVQQFWQWTGFGEQKGWDFMQLLLVPALLAIGGFWLNQQSAQRQDALNQQRREQDQQLADDKANQDTLAKYLDQMADSLKDGLLQAKPGTEKFIIAQARTVTALQSLDRRRQHLIIQFLRASGLSQTSKQTIYELAAQDTVLLYQAQMEKAKLSNSDLSGSVFIQANLQDANLGCNSPESADPNQCSDLREADFRGVNFNNANLQGADLSYANLWGAQLDNADLSYANLSNTNLDRADIYKARFSGAILIGTRLEDRYVWGQINPEQLEGENPPLLCRVRLPKGTQVNPNRDCDRLPMVLHTRYPQRFKTVEDAKNYVQGRIRAIG